MSIYLPYFFRSGDSRQRTAYNHLVGSSGRRDMREDDRRQHRERDERRERSERDERRERERRRDPSPDRRSPSNPTGRSPDQRDRRSRSKSSERLRDSSAGASNSVREQGGQADRAAKNDRDQNQRPANPPPRRQDPGNKENTAQASNPPKTHHRKLVPGKLLNSFSLE